jgi:hypothetical protein
MGEPFGATERTDAWWVQPVAQGLAQLVLGAPLGFRGTCYYYRRAYYRAFFADPTACGVGGPRGSGYAGDTISSRDDAGAGPSMYSVPGN